MDKGANPARWMVDKEDRICFICHKYISDNGDGTDDDLRMYHYVGKEPRKHKKLHITICNKCLCPKNYTGCGCGG